MKTSHSLNGALVLAAALSSIAGSCAFAQTEVMLPTGSYTNSNGTFYNYIDVTNFQYQGVTYSANTTGTVDDTETIQLAIKAAFEQNAALSTRFGDQGANTIVYFPTGTYEVTNTLEKTGGILTGQYPGTSSTDSWEPGLYLQGASQAGTVIQLANSVFTGTSGVAVIATQTESGSSAAAFRNYIRNMTINTGTNNPGAIGISFIANNRGGIYNVTVTSNDSSTPANIGIDMEKEYPGPAILKDVTVNGFKSGIVVGNQEYGMTMEHIYLNNQYTVGIHNEQNSLTIRDLESTESVPAIDVGRAQLTLRDSTLTGIGSGTSTYAIYTTTPTDTYTNIYCHNVSCTGYGTVVSYTGHNVSGNGSTPVLLTDYSNSGTFLGQSNSIAGSINLPVEETPDFNTTDMAQWTNAAPGGPSSTGDNYTNISNAVNSTTQSVAYLPPGVYPISKTIHIGAGSVCQKFIGLGAVICPENSSFPANSPLIQFDGGSASTTCLQNLNLCNSTATSHTLTVTSPCVIDNSSQTLVVENCDMGGYSNTSSGVGDLFLEDTTMTAGGGQGPYGSINIAYPQDVYARQLNVEGVVSSPGNTAGNYVWNQGGVMWILGYKTEAGGSHVAGMNTMLYNSTNAWTEMDGGFFFPNSTNAATVPMIVNNQGHLSANFTTWLEGTGNASYPTDIQDTEMVGASLVTTNLPYTVFYGTGGNPGYTNTCNLFSGSSSVYNEVLAAYAFENSRTNYAPDGSTFNNGSGYTNTGYWSNGGTNYVAVNYAGTTNNAPPMQDLQAGQYFTFKVSPSVLSYLDLTSIIVPVTRPIENSANNYTLYGVPLGGPNSGQTNLLINGTGNNGIHGGEVTIGTAPLTNSAYQGISSMQFYIIFNGSNQGLGTDYVGNVIVQGAETSQTNAP